MASPPSPAHPSPPSFEAVRVPCPQCGQQTVYSPANRWRPFCSERCKMIDMGAWASEEFRIQAAAPPDPDDTREQ